LLLGHHTALRDPLDFEDIRIILYLRLRFVVYRFNFQVGFGVEFGLILERRTRPTRLDWMLDVHGKEIVVVVT